MNNLPIIELAISLILVYFIFSIVISNIQELIEGIFIKSRGSFLKEAINKVFNDPQNKNWAEFIYSHPLINKLKRKPKSNPSYISPDTFSNCLIDIFINEGKQIEIDSKQKDDVKYSEKFSGNNSLDNFKEGLKKLNKSDVKDLLEAIAIDCNEIKELKTKINDWYNSYMDRISGWYKRKIRLVTFIIASLVTLILNIDTIGISKELWSNKVLRESVVIYAENIVRDGHPMYVVNDTIQGNDTLTLQKFKQDVQDIDSLISEIETLELPIGWEFAGSLGCTLKTNIDSYPLKILGWIITIFALSMGAPFWFKILSKLVNMRNTGEPPKKSEEK